MSKRTAITGLVALTLAIVSINLIAGNNALYPEDLPPNTLGIVATLIGGVAGVASQVTTNRAAKMAMGLFSWIGFLGSVFMTTLNLFLGYQH